MRVLDACLQESYILSFSSLVEKYKSFNEAIVLIQTIEDDKAFSKENLIFKLEQITKTLNNLKVFKAFNDGFNKTDEYYSNSKSPKIIKFLFIWYFLLNF